MTRPAEPRLGKLEELARLGVHGPPGPVGIGLQVELAALDGALQLVVAARAEHRRVEVALDEGQPPADLAEGLVLPVADDAGDALARRRMAVEVGHEGGLFQVHPHRGVAPDAKIAVGAVGELVQLGLHGVEDRAHLRVGVRRDRPFAVDLCMARRAGARRRKPVFGEQRLVLGAAARLSRGCSPAAVVSPAAATVSSAAISPAAVIVIEAVNAPAAASRLTHGSAAHRREPIGQGWSRMRLVLRRYA